MINLIEKIKDINKDYDEPIIKSYKGIEHDNWYEVILQLDTHYDYDDCILNEWRVKFKSYSYYISVKNNRLFISYLITK